MHDPRTSPSHRTAAIAVAIALSLAVGAISPIAALAFVLALPVFLAAVAAEAIERRRDERVRR